MCGSGRASGGPGCVDYVCSSRRKVDAVFVLLYTLITKCFLLNVFILFQIAFSFPWTLDVFVIIARDRTGMRYKIPHQRIEWVIFLFQVSEFASFSYFSILSLEEERMK